MMKLPQVSIDLQDTQWPFTYTDHDRTIVRAIVVDDAGSYYFVRAVRDDEFGAATLIETSGGGVEPGEDLSAAIQRELREELGAQVEIIARIGVVSDYYNLIHRHNINHYFLCRVRSFGDRHLTEDEIHQFHLSTLKLSYDEAVAEYETRACTRLGRLIANRELPILKRAKLLLDGRAPARIWCFGDSNTYGYDPCGFFGGRYTAPWPELLAQKTGLQVYNDGRNGRMIPERAYEWDQLRSDAERFRADLLIVMLGTNDLLNGARAEETTDRMAAFIAQCARLPVLLISPPFLKRGAWVPEDSLVEESIELSRQYKALAERIGAGYANAGEWDVELAYDGVHFTQEGHECFAGALAKVF